MGSQRVRHEWVHIYTLLDGASGKEPTCYCRGHKRYEFDPHIGKIPWRRAWQLTQIFLPGEFHGQRSLACYIARGHKESDLTEQTLGSRLWDQQMPKCWTWLSRLWDFGIIRELQFVVCIHGEPHASLCMPKEGEQLYKKEEELWKALVHMTMAFHWLRLC